MYKRQRKVHSQGCPGPPSILALLLPPLLRGARAIILPTSVSRRKVRTAGAARLS